MQFLVANTDLQALQANPAPVKLQIGSKLDSLARAPTRTSARAALEDTDKLIQALDGADMVFVTTGLGGGREPARPPSSRASRASLGAPTIAVTKPFKFEGRKRQTQAEAGLDALRDRVWTQIAIPNERLLAIINRTTTFGEAFSTADDVLSRRFRGFPT